MDLNTEQMFTQKLTEATDRKTVIIATHRLPVVNAVNRVIVLSEGKVVLDEPREEALKKLIQQPKD